MDNVIALKPSTKSKYSEDLMDLRNTLVQIKDKLYAKSEEKQHIHDLLLDGMRSGKFNTEEVQFSIYLIRNYITGHNCEGFLNTARSS